MRLCGCDDRDRVSTGRQNRVEVATGGLLLYRYRQAADPALFHRGHEQAPIVGLVRLCGALPKHADFSKWTVRSGGMSITTRRSRRFTEPYGMLLAGVYDLLESDRVEYRDQVKQGLALRRAVFPETVSGVV